MQSSFLPGHGSTLPAARRTTPMAKLLSSYLRHLSLSPVSKPKPSLTKSLSSHRTGLLSPPLLQPTRTSTSSNRRRRRPPIPCRGLAAIADGGEGTSRRRWLEVAGEAVSTAFPVWVALSCAVGLAKPGWLGWVEPRWMVTGITVTMLGMGMTLTLDDLRGALAMPKELPTGFLLHYSVMPLSGYFVSKLLRLPSPYAAGLILVGCCPAATASNIVTYIARGNVALSVLMTAASTLAAVVTTPFLTAKLAGQYITVDAAALFLSTLQVVLLPVLAGAILNQYFRSIVKFVSPVMPPIAVGTTAVFIGKAIAQSASAILVSGQQVVFSVTLLHASGYFLGYLLSRILGINVSSSRTISFQVGMQNSVLGVVLANQHFGNPLAAVPCAISSFCQTLFGSTLAGMWRQSAIPNQMQDSSTLHAK